MAAITSHTKLDPLKASRLGTDPRKAGLPEVPAHICKLLLTGPTETIYELIGARDGLGFSFAIADVTQSAAHFHRNLLESYMVIAGQLDVSIDGITSVLQPGDSIFIPRGAIHVAKSLTDEPARLLVPCVPGWVFEDFNLANTKNPSDKPEIKIVEARVAAVLPEINGRLYQRQVKSATQTIYEVVRQEDELNFSFAIVDLTGSTELQSAREVTGYTAITYDLAVVVGDRVHVLHPGEFLSIPKGTMHSVRSLDHLPVRFMLCQMEKSRA